MKKIIDIRKLKAYMWVDEDTLKVVDLKDTPHYQFLCGNKQPYIDYNAAYRPNYPAERFQELIDNFDSGKAGVITCNCLRGDKEEYIISDGFHRACIFLYKGWESITISSIYIMI